MIRGIIFDCFGVLTTDGWLQFREQHFHEGTSGYRQISQLNRQADTGYITHDEFMEAIAELSHVDLKEVKNTLEQRSPNNTLFDYIRDELKPKYKIGLLSNASDDWTEELFSPDQVSLFDEKVFSFQIGVDKPHPAMYETIASRMGLLPEECIFIDDREGFVAGAKDVGMRGFVYETNTATKQNIDEIIAEAN